MLLEEQVIKIKQIPSDKLIDVYQLIHYFRLGLLHEQLSQVGWANDKAVCPPYLTEFYCSRILHYWLVFNSFFDKLRVAVRLCLTCKQSLQSQTPVNLSMKTFQVFET